MKDYQEETYGRHIADVYDEFYAGFDPAIIDLLAELAQGGPALELGIGTGRIAIPLHEKGVAVQGIDISEEMLSKLRAKPHGGEIEVVGGSFADFDLGRQFKLVYVVFNTFFGLITQEEQIGCFESVKKHLAEDGIFLLEVFMPDLSRFAGHQNVRTVELTEDTVRLDASQIDPVTQQVSGQHITLSNNGVRLYPVKLRYAWPSELDLMAQIVGLSLRHRWGSWLKDEFTKNSPRHISVYGLKE